MKLFVVLVLSCPIFAMASGGSEAGNGGGAAEANFSYAYNHVAQFIFNCLRSGRCDDAGTEGRSVLKQIAENMAREYDQGQLVFKSETANPGFFKIDANVRIAKTGDFIRDLIYINSDLIYTEDAHQKQKPLSVISALAVLVHEFGHHHGIKDHSKLDNWAAVVTRANPDAVQYSIGSFRFEPVQSIKPPTGPAWPLDVYTKIFEIELFNCFAEGEPSRISIGATAHDRDQIDITDSVKAALGFDLARHKNLRIYNLNWANPPVKRTPGNHEVQIGFEYMFENQSDSSFNSGDTLHHADIVLTYFIAELNAPPTFVREQIRVQLQK